MRHTTLHCLKSVSYCAQLLNGFYVKVTEVPFALVLTKPDFDLQGQLCVFFLEQSANFQREDYFSVQSSTGGQEADIPALRLGNLENKSVFRNPYV